MKIKKSIKKFWNFLKKDSWQSFLVSLILLAIMIKFVFFPLLSFFTGSALPLVVVESCSMYHGTNFDEWWEYGGEWYEKNGITKEQFQKFPMKNGFNKGDIIFVLGKTKLETGDIIIFKANEGADQKKAIIHRLVSTQPYATKGDNNANQLTKETNNRKIDETFISENRIIGEAVFRIPALGWIKLIFFEPLRAKEERGFCS